MVKRAEWSKLRVCWNEHESLKTNSVGTALVSVGFISDCANQPERLSEIKLFLRLCPLKSVYE